MKFSFVIPCFNEENNIPLLFQRLQEVLVGRDNVEIILVNNGSTDNSHSVINEMLVKFSDLCVRQHSISENMGYGFGIMSGLLVAKGDILGWTHADLQTDLADILTAFDVYVEKSISANNKKYIVKGKRKNRRILEFIFTFGMQLVSLAILRQWFKDINAQPKVFDRDFYEKFLKNGAPSDFSLDLYLLYQAKVAGYYVLTIPVYFAKRKYGEAKGGGSWKTRIKLIKRTINYILKLRKEKLIN